MAVMTIFPRLLTNPISLSMGQGNPGVKTAEHYIQYTYPERAKTINHFHGY